MKKIITIIMALVLCLGMLAITACGGGTAKPSGEETGSAKESERAASGDTVTLKFSHSWPEQHPLAQRWALWGEEIEKRTEGRIQVEMYGAAQLSTSAEDYESMVQGISDVTVVIPSYTPGVFPLSELYELPVGYNGPQSMGDVFYQLYKEFQPEEWNEVKVLTMYAVGPGVICSKKPVKDLESLKGMQIRATGTTGKALAALGAAPVSITYPESYEAISRGTCDGLIGAWETFKSWSLDEVADNYLGVSFLYTSPFVFAMNLDTWNAIPDDLKPIVEEVSEEWGRKMGEWAYEDTTVDGIEYLTAQGKNISILPDSEAERWKELIQPVIDEAVEEREAMGLPAKEFYERMLELIPECNEKYESVDEAVINGMK